MDPISRGYTPARFVNAIEVKSGDSVLFRMEGGISISENPNLHFTYTTSPHTDLEFTAKDTDGTTFTGSSKPDPS
jgi:sulfur-oxidizing protein SoxY